MLAAAHQRRRSARQKTGPQRRGGARPRPPGAAQSCVRSRRPAVQVAGLQDDGDDDKRVADPLVHASPSPCRPARSCPASQPLDTRLLHRNVGLAGRHGCHAKQLAAAGSGRRARTCGLRCADAHGCAGTQVQTGRHSHAHTAMPPGHLSPRSQHHPPTHPPLRVLQADLQGIAMRHHAAAPAEYLVAQAPLAAAPAARAHARRDLEHLRVGSGRRAGGGVGERRRRAAGGNITPAMLALAWRHSSHRALSGRRGPAPFWAERGR